MADVGCGEIERPQRWAIPFDPEMSEKDVDAVLGFEPFCRIDPEAFSASVPLRGVLRNDCAIRHYSAGDLIVRAGDYGNSAFFILGGAVRVMVDPLDERLLGRGKTRHRSFRHALARLWRRPHVPEVRDLDGTHRSGPVRSIAPNAIPHMFLQDVPAILDQHRTARVGAGEFIGAGAVLGRTERIATMFAEEPCLLVEIRWQGLRELRARAPEIKRHIDELYRQNNLSTHLRQTFLLAALSDATIEELARETQFLSFGSFEWQGAYKKLRDAPVGQELAAEPVIVRQGDYPNGIFLIRSGYVRVSEAYNHGERTVSYLGRGQLFGFDEIRHNWKTGESAPFAHTLRAVGYVDVLYLPTPAVERLVLPAFQDRCLPDDRTHAEPTSVESAYLQDAATKLGPDVLEFLVEHRFVNGTATMIIDLERCTRCDDCVRACAAAHDDNPRFIRHGPEINGFMIANACMHCSDPVCMIGCPTGAIHRETAEGQVVIDDLTCIGCATCANSCPYDNIQMVNVHRADGHLYLDAHTHLPIQKATKCDLCFDQLTGPACVQACPHDALTRADMRDVRGLSRWLNK
ncbi:MAG TPA: cyclic nucleotide-binding domain-containing protein [Candidatus Bathyarchaeia archaeon]|nr:cyclic nucleotide-binding domain-containing protein [Candidatus Bathyarchaeia archaeon]